MAPSKLARLRLLRELIAEPLDHDAIERTIKTDLALSVKLRCYLNSASFGWRSQIDSIKHALVLLGDGPFRQWAALVAIAMIGDDKPEELLVMSLLRARFCEQLALGARRPRSPAPTRPPSPTSAARGTTRRCAGCRCGSQRWRGSGRKRCSGRTRSSSAGWGQTAEKRLHH